MDEGVQGLMDEGVQGLRDKGIKETLRPLRPWREVSDWYEQVQGDKKMICFYAPFFVPWR